MPFLFSPRHRPLTVPLLAFGLLVASVSGAHAQLLNGSFENNFSNWTLLPGPGAVPGTIMTDQGQGNWFGEDAPAGVRMAFIDTDNTRGSRTDTQLESFLGVSGGTLDNLGQGNVFDGAAFYQTVNSANAGATVTFSWNFLTSEDPSFNPQNDFAFFFLSGPGITNNGSFNIIAHRADATTDTPFPAPSGVTSPNRSDDYLFETGFVNSPTFTLPQAGTYRIGFGIVDVGNGSIPSALLVDNVVFTAGPVAGTAPEPASLALLSMTGLVGLIARRRGSRRAR